MWYKYASVRDSILSLLMLGDPDIHSWLWEKVTDGDDKKLYKKLVFKYHPDRSPDSANILSDITEVESLSTEMIKEFLQALDISGQTGLSFLKSLFNKADDLETQGLDIVNRIKNLGQDARATQEYTEEDIRERQEKINKSIRKVNPEQESTFSRLNSMFENI